MTKPMTLNVRLSGRLGGFVAANVADDGSYDNFPGCPVPAAFGVKGYVCRYQQHLNYWKTLPSGDIGIVTVLHARMHQIDRFRDEFAA